MTKTACRIELDRFGNERYCQVMLASDAHQELYEELGRLEIISPPRITTNHHELIDYEDFSVSSCVELSGLRISRFIYSF